MTRNDLAERTALLCKKFERGLTRQESVRLQALTDMAAVSSPRVTEEDLARLRRMEERTANAAKTVQRIDRLLRETP